MDPLTSLSDSLALLAQSAGKRLFHVPSPLGGRTALGFDGKHLLVPAMQADDGEELTILGPGGQEVTAKVVGFHPGLGLAVLELAEAQPSTAFSAKKGLPALGSLLLTLAYPSPEGVEARLDAVRFAGGTEGDDESYIQTDGHPFPGFEGAALLAPSGELSGFILANRPGNRGFALPAARAVALALEIAERGFAGRAWLGLSTIPIEAPAAFKALGGAEQETALLVAGLEAGGPAELAGIMVGDLILEMGGKALSVPEELGDLLGEALPGQSVGFSLLRSGKRIELGVTLTKAEPGSGRREGRARGRPGGGGWGHHGHGGHRGPEGCEGPEGHGGHRGGPSECCGGR